MPYRGERTQLGIAISRAREERGLSQAELAHVIKVATGANVSQGAIAAIERGQTKQPRVETINHIAIVLGLNAEELKVLAGMRMPDAIAYVHGDEKGKRVELFSAQLLLMPEDVTYRVIEAARLMANLHAIDQEQVLALIRGMVEKASRKADNV